MKISYHESATLKFLLTNIVNSNNWYATILGSSSKKSHSDESKKPRDTVTFQILSVTACALYRTLKFNQGDKHTTVGGNLTVKVCKTSNINNNLYAKM
jgi:hypothetical protein